MREDKPIAAFVLGFGFMRAWALVLLGRVGVSLPLTAPAGLSLLGTFAPTLIVFLAILAVLPAKHQANLISQNLFVLTTALLAIGAILLELDGDILLQVGSVVSAAGFSLLLVQCGIASSLVSHRRLIASLMWGFIFAGGICLVSAFLPHAIASIVFCLCGPLSIICLHSLISRTNQTASKPAKKAWTALGSGDDAHNRWANGGKALLGRLVLSMFCIELVARSALMITGEYAVRIFAYPSWSFEVSRFLGTLLSVVIFYAFIRQSDKPLKRLYTLVPIMLVSSSLILLFGGMGAPLVTYTLAFTAGAWLETAFWVFFSHSCTTIGKPPVYIWIAGRMAFWLSTFVGVVFWAAQSVIYEGGLISNEAAVATLVALMALGTILVSMLVLPPEAIGRLSIMGNRDNRGLTGDVPLTSQVLLDETLASISLKAGLSPRENEVFVLLSKGRSNPYIQEHLCISQGTVRSHKDRIYRKLGIHSKQELIDLIEASGRSKSGGLR